MAPEPLKPLYLSTMVGSDSRYMFPRIGCSRGDFLSHNYLCFLRLSFMHAVYFYLVSSWAFWYVLVCTSNLIVVRLPRVRPIYSRGFLFLMGCCRSLFRIPLGCSFRRILFFDEFVF